MDKKQIEEKLSESACFIFVDEDERSGIECLVGLKPRLYNTQGHNLYKYDIVENANCKSRLTTYKSLLIQIMEENELNNLEIEKPNYVYCDEVDDIAAILFSQLTKKGVKCFSLLLESLEDKDNISEYHMAFKKEVSERLEKYPISIREPWPKKEQNPHFYGELYQNEDYATEIAQKEIFEKSAKYDKSNANGKYFNVRNGRRVTCFQPKECIGTIYMFGRCTILGTLVEDQYTIASILQKKLLEKGYIYRVENCGDIVPPYEVDARLEEISQYSEKDIIIYMPLNVNKPFANVPGIALNKIYERHQIPSTWIADLYAHGNHKVNQVIADDILEMLKPYLLKKVIRKSDKFRFNIYETMQRYVQHKYLEKYFGNYYCKSHKNIGAIFMECDPFDRRHRYLIEQAKQQIDYLVVFVMEEDIYRSCLFSFETRFRLVIEGTKDLENIMVVSSGFFDLLGINFPRNLIRTEQRVFNYSKHDIDMFADYIASSLHITHCFVEMEPDYEIVKMHNEVMKKILPQKGISYIEIPTMPKGEAVSTSTIQRYLRNEEYDKAFGMLTESTRQYCMRLAGLID